MIDQTMANVESVLELLVLLGFFVYAVRQWRINIRYRQGIDRGRRIVFDELPKYEPERKVNQSPPDQQ